MRKLFLLITLVMFSGIISGQERNFLIVEMMKVDNVQEGDYWETEAFWEKIHDQRVKSGEITGWRLWELKPGGENQGYQYMTVTAFNDPVKMFHGTDLMESAKMAYPDMTEEELLQKLNNSAHTRDLAERIYVEQISSTTGEFAMPLGTVIFLNFMKVDPENTEAYEMAENNFFKPFHQEDVNNKVRNYWAMYRYLLPAGSDAYASHITVDAYENFDQVFNGRVEELPALTAEQTSSMEEGLATRDHKMVYIGRLLRKVQ